MTNQLMSNLLEEKGGSIFWILIVLLSFGGLIALSIWSKFNNSLEGIILSVIFFFMVIGGVVLSEGKIFKAGGWSRNSLSILLGFLVYALYTTFAKSTYSVLSVSENTLFSAISGQLPLSLEFIMTAFIIPICEETFFLFGITFSTIIIISLIGKSLSKSSPKISSFFQSSWTQILLACIVSGVTFAIFHMGKQSLTFMIAAIVFRSFATIVIFGDLKFNLIPYVVIGYAFSLGMHIGNNWGVFGLGRGFGILVDNFVPLGSIIIILIVAIVIGAVNELKLLKNGSYRRQNQNF